ERQSRPPELVVIQPVNEWACTSCSGTGDLLIMEGDGPLCLSCAGMDHLVLLPAGNATLSRRARKASQLSAVVVRWSRTRKRYERGGVPAEKAALEQAEEAARAEDDVPFQVRMTAEILRLFPGCPQERAQAIARQAGRRRGGTSATALDDEAVTLAVLTSV